jgi:hypothetical protein
MLVFKEILIAEVGICISIGGKYLILVNRGSSVDTVIGVQAGHSRNWNSIPGRAGARDICRLHGIGIGSEAHRAFYTVLIGAVYQGIKRPGHESHRIDPRIPASSGIRTHDPNV